MAIKDIVKGICNITRCKYDVYTKEKIDEMTIIENKDLKDVLKTGYFILGEGVTDNYKNGNIPYVPISKGLTLINTSVEGTYNENANGSVTKVPCYNINQVIINGSAHYCRSFQVIKEGLTIRENSMSPWSYRSTVTTENIHQDIYTNGGPVNAGYKIDGNDVFVARHSYDFGDSQALDISVDYITDNTILVKFEGMHDMLGYHIPLDYVFFSGADKSFDSTTIQAALDVSDRRIRLQANGTACTGYINMYFYNQQ